METRNYLVTVKVNVLVGITGNDGRHKARSKSTVLCKGCPELVLELLPSHEEGFGGGDKKGVDIPLVLDLSRPSIEQVGVYHADLTKPHPKQTITVYKLKGEEGGKMYGLGIVRVVEQAKSIRRVLLRHHINDLDDRLDAQRDCLVPLPLSKHDSIVLVSGLPPLADKLLHNPCIGKFDVVDHAERLRGQSDSRRLTLCADALRVGGMVRAVRL